MQMFYLNCIIVILMMNISMAQWTITHYEGYDKSFTQNKLDNYTQLNCVAYNLPIIAQLESLQKVISLYNFTPFAKTKILVEYIVPIDSYYTIKIQNKTIDIHQTGELNYGFSMINDCFNTSNYQLLSFNYELEGKNYTEISILIQLVEDELNQQKRYVGIKQIHVFQVKCPQNCNECEQKPQEQMKCLECQKNFTYQENQNKCYCRNFYFQNQCLEKCPEGYTTNKYSACTKVEILETQSLGQNIKVKQNKGFAQQIKLQKSSQIIMEMDLILSNFKAFQQFSIMINDVYMGCISNYYSNLYISIFNISESQCQYSKNCTQVKLLSPIIDVNSSILNLSSDLKPIKIKLSKPRYNRLENKSDQKYQQLDSEFIIQNIQITQLLIEEVICVQQNCKICDQNSYYEEKCKQCQEGFYLFENQCVRQCPEQSVQEGFYCQTIQNKQSNSQIIINDIEINEQNWAGQISMQDTRSQIQYKFDKTNLLFGGQWRNQEFTKILILDPHYALTYKFTVKYIDLTNEDEGKGFFYQLDGGQYNFIKPKELIQVDGDSNKPDSIILYSKYFNHQTNDIMITIGCNTNGYCFLQDYYLIIHKCTPYCKSCTGPSKSECLEFIKSSYEFDTKTKQCRTGYYESEDKVCERCQDHNCSQCSSRNNCQICKKGCQLHLQGFLCVCE